MYVIIREVYKIDLIFFFKQKTAYEMSISDWSSDVCSSDLAPGGSFRIAHRGCRSCGSLTDDALDGLCPHPRHDVAAPFLLKRFERFHRLRGFVQIGQAVARDRGGDGRTADEIGRAHV